MSQITYRKLVRDKVPEYILQDGKKAVTKRLDDDELYEDALREKLTEEMDEVLIASEADELQAELADLFEVAYAYARCYRISPEDIETTRLAKLNERGGFEQRLFLEKVDDAGDK